MTQNQNEAVNGQLWSKCSKTKFCGARKVRIAACETIMVFNTGAASKAVTMELCQITPGVNTMQAFRQQDRSRIKSTSQKISSKYFIVAYCGSFVVITLLSDYNFVKNTFL